MGPLRKRHININNFIQGSLCLEGNTIMLSRMAPDPPCCRSRQRDLRSGAGSGCLRSRGVTSSCCPGMSCRSADCRNVHYERGPFTGMIFAALESLNCLELSAPNHKSQIAGDLKSRSPNRKNFPQIAVSSSSNRTLKSSDL